MIDVDELLGAEGRENVPLDVPVLASQRRGSQIDDASPPHLDPLGHGQPAGAGVDVGPVELRVLDERELAIGVDLVVVVLLIAVIGASLGRRR
jgi:hypothetical protein